MAGETQEPSQPDPEKNRLECEKLKAEREMILRQIEKLHAEEEKTRLESEKLRDDKKRNVLEFEKLTAETAVIKRRFWTKAEFWTAFTPALFALFSLYWIYHKNYFNVDRIKQETQQLQTSNENLLVQIKNERLDIKAKVNEAYLSNLVAQTAFLSNTVATLSNNIIKLQFDRDELGKVTNSLQAELSRLAGSETNAARLATELAHAKSALNFARWQYYAVSNNVIVMAERVNKRLSEMPINPHLSLGDTLASMTAYIHSVTASIKTNSLEPFIELAPDPEHPTNKIRLLMPDSGSQSIPTNIFPNNP